MPAYRDGSLEGQRVLLVPLAVSDPLGDERTRRLGHVSKTSPEKPLATAIVVSSLFANQDRTTTVNHKILFGGEGVVGAAAERDVAEAMLAPMREGERVM
jgi:hypothetical protein